ncbi:hypothetical protein LCGC14_1753550 [marine sediment metagenome]|uniref:Uncharacterized protein n=1 Tax=marine sediment metagenome TaxID=412755 RepID=A0A0F9H393_9ZZZZ
MINLKANGKWVSISYDGDKDPIVVSAEVLLTFLEMNYPNEFRELLEFRDEKRPDSRSLPSPLQAQNNTGGTR